MPYVEIKALWSFKIRDERFVHKNQLTQRKLWNFENWTNGMQKSEFLKLIILSFHEKF